MDHYRLVIQDPAVDNVHDIYTGDGGFAFLGKNRKAKRQCEKDQYKSHIGFRFYYLQGRITGIWTIED